MSEREKLFCAIGCVSGILFMLIATFDSQDKLKAANAALYACGLTVEP